MSNSTFSNWTSRDDRILMAVLSTTPLHPSNNAPDLIKLTESMSNLSSSLFLIEGIHYPPYTPQQVLYGYLTQLPRLLEKYPIAKTISVPPSPIPAPKKLKPNILWSELDDRLLMYAYTELGQVFNPEAIATRMNELVEELNLPRLRIYYGDGVERVLRRRGCVLLRAAEGERGDEREVRVGMETDWRVVMGEFLESEYGFVSESEDESFDEGVEVGYLAQPEPEPSDLFFETADGMVWTGTGDFDSWLGETVGRIEFDALEQEQDLGAMEISDNMEEN